MHEWGEGVVSSRFYYFFYYPRTTHLCTYLSTIFLSIYRFCIGIGRRPSSSPWLGLPRPRACLSPLKGSFKEEQFLWMSQGDKNTHTHTHTDRGHSIKIVGGISVNNFFSFSLSLNVQTHARFKLGSTVVSKLMMAMMTRLPCSVSGLG